MDRSRRPHSVSSTYSRTRCLSVGLRASHSAVIVLRFVLQSEFEGTALIGTNRRLLAVPLSALDDDSVKWYILYHDIAYNIWSPCSASSHGPRKRGDAGCMGRGDVHCRGGTSDRLPQTQPKRNNPSYADAPA